MLLSAADTSEMMQCLQGEKLVGVENSQNFPVSSIVKISGHFTLLKQLDGIWAHTLVLRTVHVCVADGAEDILLELRGTL